MISKAAWQPQDHISGQWYAYAIEGALYEADDAADHAWGSWLLWPGRLTRCCNCGQDGALKTFPGRILLCQYSKCSTGSSQWYLGAAEGAADGVTVAVHHRCAWPLNSYVSGNRDVWGRRQHKQVSDDPRICRARQSQTDR